MTFHCNNPTVKLTERSIPNGIAYYINGEGELVYSLDIPDTSEYLAIENHSPFWCRPFWGCSGGGRFDGAMLTYFPQVWCSDNTDAPSRLTIQYGSSFAYPVCTMGATCLLVPIKSHGERFPWLPVRSRQCTELSLRTSFFHSA